MEHMWNGSMFCEVFHGSSPVPSPLRRPRRLSPQQVTDLEARLSGFSTRMEALAALDALPVAREGRMAGAGDLSGAADRRPA